MIFKTFEDGDVVAGRSTKVASGFWPDGSTNWTSSKFSHNWGELITTAAPSPSYGASPYDVRKTMYYLDVYPDSTEINNPYFSVSYGHIAGNVGSGSFNTETSSILVSPARVIYNQYKNLLLGSSDVDGLFSFLTGSKSASGGLGKIDANDIFVLNFSSYKMKDRIDEGVFQISFSGSNKVLTLIDDSKYQSQTLNVYNLIEGTTDQSLQPASTIQYQGVGLLYPANGIAIFNANKLNQLLGGMTASYTNPLDNTTNTYTYNENSVNLNKTVNHYVFLKSIIDAGSSTTGADPYNGNPTARPECGKTMNIRKSEYVPSRHYFIRIKNRNYNYSNNPTYVYDGTDGIHPKGQIRNDDFINDPRTYITSVGLYNSDNELVAIAKLSRPAIKDFNSELLIRARIDM